MSVIINVPEELYQKAVEIAEAQHVPVDEVFVSAFVEQLAAWDRLKQKAAAGSRDKFLSVLDKVPDVDPEEHDRL
jgi:hypothetical protein